MNKTKIEWCDYTWNPIVGCSPISKGCAHCYAAAISRRFKLPWGKAHFMPARLPEPMKERTPGRVFVCSMSDIGHESVEPLWRHAIASAMRSAPHHQFIVLTKRPGQWLRDLPPSCWVGVTVERTNFLRRWTDLCNEAWPQAVKFISAEPLLGPLSLTYFIEQPDWVIAGHETGPGKRPCDPAWITALEKQSPCFFDKRPLIGGKPGSRTRQFPHPLQDTP